MMELLNDTGGRAAKIIKSIAGIAVSFLNPNPSHLVKIV